MRKLLNYDIKNIISDLKWNDIEIDNEQYQIELMAGHKKTKYYIPLAETCFSVNELITLTDTLKKYKGVLDLDKTEVYSSHYGDYLTLHLVSAVEEEGKEMFVKMRDKDGA